MRIIRSLVPGQREQMRSVVTIGNFDGVHLGHREIFRRVVSRAREDGGVATVLTFVPHPLKLLAPQRAPLLINTYAERERMIAASCIDTLVTLSFDRQLAELDAHDFVTRVLVDALDVRRLIVGYDYAFGRNRQGNSAFLQECGRQFGFEVEILAAQLRDEEVYSSTRIRELIRAGEVEQAVALLGRHFSLEGEVVRGAGRGRELGFPTANLCSDKELLPAPGVYAVKVRCGEELYNGVVNIGENPTFGGGALSVEVHLFDYSAELYGKTLRIYFIQRLRDEVRFPSVAALVDAISADVVRAREVLARTRLIVYREYLDCGSEPPVDAG